MKLYDYFKYKIILVAQTYTIRAIFIHFLISFFSILLRLIIRIHNARNCWISLDIAKFDYLFFVNFAMLADRRAMSIQVQGEWTWEGTFLLE